MNQKSAAVLFSLTLLAARPASAANDTWSGAAMPDGNWSNAANWDTAPAAKDFLFFDNGSGTQPFTTNDLGTGTIFGNIAFNSGSVSFTNSGNGIVLTNAVQDASVLTLSGGGITNASASAQTILFALTNSAGHHVVTTTSGAGQLNLNGTFGINSGATLQFIKSGGSINYSSAGLSTINGILGGWAVIGLGSNFGDWATLDGSVNVVAYSSYTTKAGNISWALSSSGGNAANNIKIIDTRGTATLNSTTAGTYDINSLLWNRGNGNPAGDETLNITGSQVMRLGTMGGIMSVHCASRTLNVGNAGGGSITAGGAANTAGSISLVANPLDDKNQRLKINAPITDNGSGAVSVNVLGWIEIKQNNTYSGGTYINKGRVQITSVATGTQTGFGSGPVYIFPGGQSFIWDNGKANVVVTNNFFIAGYGTFEDMGGVLRLTGNGINYSGTINLLGPAAVGGTATMSGKISGAGSFIIGEHWDNGAITLSTAANDYSGDTVINNPTSTAQNYLVISGSSFNNILPHGAGKGNVNLVGNSGTSWAEFDLKGSTQTINGLTNSGANAANTFVESSAAGGVIVVGYNNASSTYGGVLRNNGGTLALTKIGTGTLTLQPGTVANTYTGNTTISNGVLALSGAVAVTSPQISVSSGATFDVSQTSFTLAAGQTLAGNGSVTGAVSTASTSIISPGFSAGMLTFQSDLTLNTGATCLFELSTTTNGANDKIIVGGNLNLAGATVQISAGALQTGRYKLITYTGALSGTAAANLVLSYSGDQSVSLDDSVAGEIDLLVSSSFVTKLTWLGDGTANVWDVNTTSNWLNGASGALFANGNAVTFNDSGSKSPAVNLSGTLSPISLLVSNNTGTYTFSGGSISGGASLVKKGNGALVLTESGDNFAGGISVSNGTLIVDNDSSGITGGANVGAGAALQLGNNDANGVLPSGTVTANGTLVLNHTDDITVGNLIAGGGTLTKTNSNTATLANINSFAGNVSIQSGTLRAWTQSALGTTNGTITIANGATLDKGWDTAKAIVVSGAGVGGAGGIVNNSGNAIFDGSGGITPSLTLTGDTTLGGNTRWDLGSPATLSSGGNNYNLAISEADGVYMEWDNVTIDANLGNIDIYTAGGGLLGIKGCGASLGNPTNTITVHTNSTLTFWGETSNNSGYAKNIRVQSGGSVNFRPQNPNVYYNSTLFLDDGANWTMVNGSGNGTVMMQPIQLNGLVHLQVGDSTVTISNVISGAGGFYWDNYNNTLVLTATNTYSGVTDIKSARTLSLTGNGSIANSSVISLENSGAILNATGRGDSTLTLASGQTLNGIGTLRGNLSVSSGATVAPGNSIGRLTVTNGNVMLAGAALMELDQSLAANDVLRATTAGASITFGGALTVTNLNGTLTLGNSFPLFSAASLAGNFSVTNLPALDPSLKWDWNPASGTLSVVASVNTSPTNITTSVSGNVLTLSWPADHIGWRLESQTNSLSAGLGTNWTDVPSAASVSSVTVTNDPANGAVFYRMVYP